MISWASKKLLNAGLAIALLATFTTVGFLNSPVSADAITGSGNSEGLASKTERWLRLRAVTRCFNINDVGRNSFNDVKNGAIFDSGDTAIGYLNEDGKVDCDGDGGEAFVRNTFTTIGFADSVAAFCSVQPMASREGSDTNSESDFEACTTRGGDQFDMNQAGYGANQKGQQVAQFKAGYQKNATSPTPWSPTPETMYWVYRSSLVEFCGAKLIGKYDPADESNVRVDKRKVVVNDVDLGTGEIVRNVYSLTRDQTDNVDDIYVDGDLNMVSNVTCSVMAEKTWDYDEDMARYVKNYIQLTGDVGSGTPDSNTIGGGDTEAVCSAGALGWIFCPLVEFMSTATNTVAEYLEGRLVFAPLLTSDQGKAIKVVWETLLTIANAGLIIAFLVIVFSQATSVGLSSYGIKKLLPKVAAAAILMNLSFYLCAIAVDVANIVGVSVQGIVQAGIDAIANTGGTDTETGASGGQWAVTAAILITALATSAFTGAIFLLLPVLVSALLAVFTAFLILAARDVIITLLIIVSPLAFLAMILPNTEQWFTKWRKLFTTMLLLFPLIMAIFYGSVLVSNMILVTGEGGGDNEAGFMTNLIALAVLTVPLFSLPFIMKTAGGVLDRIGLLVNNRNKGFVDRTRKKSGEWMGNSSYQRARGARKSETQARRNRDFYEAMAGGGSRRKRVSGVAGYTGLGTTMVTSGGRLDARRTNENIGDMYRKQQTEATGRSLASLVEGGGFSQGTSYRLVGSNGQELLASTQNHRDMVPSVLASRGATLEVTDVSGKTREYRGDDIKGAVMSKTAQMGDVPLTESVLQMGGETAAGMREFINYNAGGFAGKAPDYIKGAAGAFNDPKAAEVVGWHPSTSERAATHANQTPEAAANIAAALTEALNNENLRGDLTVGSVRNLVGQENTAIWSGLDTQGQQDVRDFLRSHANPTPTPPPNPNPGPGPNPGPTPPPNPNPGPTPNPPGNP